jgi:hypothetical protein
MEEIKINQDEIKFNNERICATCNLLKKHNVRINKAGVKCMTGLKCISCSSKINNQRLRDRKNEAGETSNYYSDYYKKNVETYKERDRIRYAKKKALKNGAIPDIIPEVIPNTISEIIQL